MNSKRFDVNSDETPGNSHQLKMVDVNSVFSKRDSKSNAINSFVYFSFFPFLFCLTSGVTSLSANPVPPVVRIRSTLLESAQET